MSHPANEPAPGKERKFYPTGKKLKKEELAIVSQFYALAHEFPEPTSEARMLCNEYLKQLGTRYNYDWTKMSIAPDGELQTFEDVDKN